MKYLLVPIEQQKVRVAYAKGLRGLWCSYQGQTRLYAPQTATNNRGAFDGAIRAPMTGKIIRLLVKSEERVSKDQLLVVMEAMKMEYRILAPQIGQIAAISCQEGDLVELGAPLLQLQ